MIKMKYVRFNEDQFVIFPLSQRHQEMAPKFTEIVSAGFVHFYPQPDATVGIRCSGHSASLEVESRGQEDSYLLRNMM